jgi:hypothetical protein
MPDYKKLALDALNKKINKLNESVLYPDNMSERMHSKLEDDLRNHTHSLGKHPIFPEGDECSFEEKIVGDRFNEIVKRYKRTYEVDNVDEQELIASSILLLNNVNKLESTHKNELEKLAIKMIREEYDMDEDVVEIHAKLVDSVNSEGTKKNKKPISVNIDFDNHEQITNLKDEVYKRRFMNALIQGASMKCNNMFHMVEDELIDIDPKLPNKYAKLMASADYMYFIIPNISNGIKGGMVKVKFPTKDNPKAIIYAEAMVFPVLINELVKGVMELLSAHGLPKDKNMGQYVIDKADFLDAEPWDMRIGPGLWTRFVNMIDVDDFNLKHHILVDLVSLPVKEFNIKMREIMANTKEGKKIIKDIVDNIKEEFKQDEFNESMNAIIDKNDDGYKYDDLFKDLDSFDVSDLF